MTPGVRSEHLVLAITQVLGATKALAAHGDAPTLAIVRAANAAMTSAIAAAGGTVVKGLGEGLLITFAAEHAREAVAALRAGRERASRVWRDFDPGCDVQVKASIGTVLAGAMGPRDDSLPDIYGHALHRLFKEPWAPFVLMPELEALVRSST